MRARTLEDMHMHALRRTEVQSQIDQVRDRPELGCVSVEPGLWSAANRSPAKEDHNPGKAPELGEKGPDKQGRQQDRHSRIGAQGRTGDGLSL
jgi:hypothetical protein